MASESGRNQILAKWQEAFTRLNGGQPGIAGLMDFTKVRDMLLRCIGAIGILTCVCDGWTLKHWFGCIAGV